LTVAQRRDVEGEIYTRLYGEPHDSSGHPGRVLGADELEPRETQAPEAVPGGPIRAGLFALAARLGLGGGGGSPGPRSPSLRRRRTFAHGRRRRGLVMTAIGVVLGLATIVGALAPDPAVEQAPKDSSKPEPRASVNSVEARSAKRDSDKAAEKRREARRKARAARRERARKAAGAAAAGSDAVAVAPRQVCVEGGCFVEGTGQPTSSPRQVAPESSGDVVIEVPDRSGGSPDYDGPLPGDSVGGGFDPGGEVEVEEID
jgi:hypothetical protein